jgi:hypothetical protein
MAKDGLFLLVKIGSSVFSGLTSNSLSYSVDTLEVTTKDSNGHKEYIAGEDGGTIDFEALYDPTYTYSLDEVFAVAKAKALVSVVFGGIVAGDEILSAQGVLTKVDLKADKNSPVTISGSIQLSGEITKSVVTDATVPVLESAGVNNASPTIIRLNLSEKLDPAYVVATTAFTPSGGKTVTNVAISGNKINLTVNSAYVAGDTITIAYTRPSGAQDLRDLSGNYLASFTAESVTNNIV